LNHPAIRRLCALPLLLALVGCSAAPAGQPTAPPTAALPTEVSTAPAEIDVAPAASPTAAEPTAPPTAEPAAPAATPPATNEAPALARTLRLQQPRLEGDDVRAVQRRLLELGYRQVGDVDGIFGPNTEQAVRAFQQDSGLEVDGIVGPRTWERLFGAEAPATVAPIVDARTGFLLGGQRGGEWLDAASTAPLLAGGERYGLFSPAAALGTATGAAPRPAGVPCDDTWVIELDPEPQPEALLALGGEWDPLLRLPAEEPTGDAAYRDAVARLLAAEGLAQPDVQVRQVLRVDLEGDGADEVLISASRLAEQRTTIAAGDYSYVLLARPVDGALQVRAIVGELHLEAAEFGASNQYTIAAVLDLNADGRLEVVVDWDYYEGAGTIVFDIDGDAATEVLGAGCGV